jgi:hypothetical protein
MEIRILRCQRRSRHRSTELSRCLRQSKNFVISSRLVDIGFVPYFWVCLSGRGVLRSAAALTRRWRRAEHLSARTACGIAISAATPSDLGNATVDEDPASVHKAALVGCKECNDPRHFLMSAGSREGRNGCREVEKRRELAPSGRPTRPMLASGVVAASCYVPMDNEFLLQYRIT